MLNMYQLWLDDLYPRAKFADALAIIEKVGHTKRMQVDRKAWIDEGKPRLSTAQDEDDLDAHVSEEVLVRPDERNNEEQALGTPVVETQHVPDEHQQSDVQAYLEPEEPDDDELDALLAESVQPALSAPRAMPAQSNSAQNDPFEDEMEAMKDMEDMW